MRFGKVGTALILAAALSTSSPSTTATRTPHGNGEILWDSFGVPHIYAKSEAAVFYGFGWAQAQAHGNILLHLYGEARARAAEYWGEPFAAQDRWLISHSVPERSLRWYQQQTPQFRKNVDSFAAGINAYAAAHRDKLDPAVLQVLPIRGIDIVGHAHRLMNYVYMASEQRALADPNANTAGGSNAWAVAPSRSASGNPLFLANPHLPWEPGQLTYFEADLHGPGIDVYGATQVGLPVLRFGINDDLAFANTVNTPQGFTSYTLSTAPGGYLFDGKVLPFKEEHRTYKVKQADGTIKVAPLMVRSSVQGPVFARADGSLVAVRVAGLDRPGMLQEYWDMDRAHDWPTFKKAVSRLQLSFANIIYADRKGHIFYLDNGIIPRHADGDYAYWFKPVPGDTARTMWKDVLGFEELPKVLDPASGFVQNANDPPWVSSWPQPLDPAKYAPYIAPNGPMSQRAQMSVKLLTATPKISFEDFVARKLSTRSLMADRLLPELIPEAEKSSDLEIVAAAALLKGWDHCFEADSRGALLFETWAGIFSPGNFTGQANYARRWSPAAPIDTPSGIKDPAAAVVMLKQAIAKTKALYGAIDRPFGDVSRFHIGNVDLPGHGGYGNAGVFRVITWTPMKNGQRTPFHGETWVSLVEFSRPMKAIGLMSYGNSSQPGSPHNTDQLPYLATKRFRTLWMTRAQVEQHLEDTTHF